MKVKSIMTEEVASIRADEPVYVAAQLMWDRDCGALPVVDPDGTIVGVVSDRDLCMSALLSGRPISDLRVGDAMARTPLTCHAEDSLRDIHATMREAQVRRIPVIDDEEHVVGIVALNDLAVEAFEANTNAAKNRRKEVAKTLAAISEHREIPVAVAD